MRRAFFCGLSGWIVACGLASAQETYQPASWDQTPLREQPASWVQNEEPVYRLPLTDPAPAPMPAAPPADQPASMEPASEPHGPIPEAPDAEPAVPDAAVLLEEAAVPLEAAEPAAAPKLWKGSFELGLDGSEGNSQTFNFRFGAEAKRKTKYHILSADFDYHKNSNDSRETANRALFDWRYERLFDPSPWTWFVHGIVDYDEFKAFDVRVAADTGLGHHFIKTESTLLAGRFGGGFSREIGGPNDQYVPELIFGSEFEHQLTERQKIIVKADYMPSLADFTNFRLRGELGWQVLLDESTNLSLKASIFDRYDSTPEGARPNDLDYALTLLWSY